jgi:hypothetical protein
VIDYGGWPAPYMSVSGRGSGKGPREPCGSYEVNEAASLHRAIPAHG